MLHLFVVLLLVLCVSGCLYLFVENPTVKIIKWERRNQLDQHQTELCEIANLEELQHSAIVYTWVNGSEKCYNDRRVQNGLGKGGTSRDKQIGELQFSIRSLLKFAPWLKGPIYIVTPGHIPDWLDRNNPRIQVIDQDDLLPADAKTPNFDTNVIEQYLYKIPGLTDVFIHMNDDYLFVKPIPPQRLFTCDGGLRFLTEINHIRHVPATQGNIWLSSVRNTVELTDKFYGGTHTYNFVKHAPFVYSRLAFEKIHEKFNKELENTLDHQIRHEDDLNVPLLHHIYMKEEGSKRLNIPIEFNPLSECDDWLLVKLVDDHHAHMRKVFTRVLNNRGPEVLLALNDEYSEDDTASLVKEFYEALLPDAPDHELPPNQLSHVISNYVGKDCIRSDSIIPSPIAKKKEVFSFRKKKWIDRKAKSSVELLNSVNGGFLGSNILLLSALFGVSFSALLSAFILKYAVSDSVFSIAFFSKRSSHRE